MKAFLHAAALCMALLCVAPLAHADQAADEAAVRKLLADQQSAWNRADIEGYMAGYWKSPKLRFASGSKITYGFDDTLANYKKRYVDAAAMGQLEFDLLELRMTGPTTALVFGRWLLKRKADQPGGLFSLVVEKFPEGWRVVADHTS